MSAFYDLATLCGNVHVTKPGRANTQGRIFSLLVVCYAKLRMVDMSNYSIREPLIASVWMRKKATQLRR